MKRVLLILAAILICLASCGKPEPVDENSKAMRETFWVSPAIIEINNYRTGIDPAKTHAIVRVHCSEEPRTEYAKWLVETFENETQVEFILKAPLADYDTDKVVIVSSDINESIKLITYLPSTNSIVVGGFLPASKRYVEVWYPAWTRYIVQCVEPYDNQLSSGYDMPPDGFLSWVKVDNPVFILKPGEVQEVKVQLDVPKDIEIENDNWEYWFRVGELPIGDSSGVSISSTARIICKVSMSD